MKTLFDFVIPFLVGVALAVFLAAFVMLMAVIGLGIVATAAGVCGG
jgi:hypothetical protein